MLVLLQEPHCHEPSGPGASPAQEAEPQGEGTCNQHPKEVEIVMSNSIEIFFHISRNLTATLEVSDSPDSIYKDWDTDLGAALKINWIILEWKWLLKLEY